MEVKLTHGLKENEVVHVDDVVSGLACNCLCPACGAVLVAKKGSINVHHFAHYNKEDCQFQAETELHYRAKKILEQAQSLCLPEFYIEHGTQVKFKEVNFVFDAVASERKLESIVPDIILFKGPYQLLIEIAVTHFIDDVKQQKINELKLPVLEIDLSYLDRNFGEEDLTDLLLTQIFNKEWKYNEKRDRLEKLAKVESDRQEAERIRIAEKEAREHALKEAFKAKEKEKREVYYLTQLRDVTKRESKSARFGIVHHVMSCPLKKRTYMGGTYANVYGDCTKCDRFRGFREEKTKIICLKKEG